MSTEHPLLSYSKTYDALTLASSTFKRICDTYQLDTKRVLDIGCGVGSHLQRFGPGSIGISTNPQEASLGKLINRDIRTANAEQLTTSLLTTEKFDAIWCNNILEHLLSPHSFLVTIKQFSHEQTILILGTPMVPFPVTLLQAKRFRGSLATAHVNFFTKHTYRLTVERAGWTVKTLSPFYSRSSTINWLISNHTPHLYLVAQNDPTYRYHAKKIKEWEHEPLYHPLIEIMNPPTDHSNNN